MPDSEHRYVPGSRFLVSARVWGLAIGFGGWIRCVFPANLSSVGEGKGRTAHDLCGGKNHL